MSITWPLQRNCAKFYGDPRGKDGKASAQWERENLALVPTPWELRFQGKRVSGIRVHKKCAESLSRVLTAIWNRVGRSQEEIDRIGMSIFGGSYVFRTMRGGKSLSMHSYGCAVDFDPARNALGNKAPAMHRLVVEEFEREGWEWGGHWKRPDGMHFQAARTKAEPARLSPRPIPQQGKTTIINAGSKPENLPPPLPPSHQAPQPLPPPSGYPNVVYRPEVERLQSALKGLGYHEVGMIDGKWGPKTRGALLTFKADNGLPLAPTVDEYTWSILARAPGRQISPTREEAVEPPSKAGKAAKGAKLTGAGLGGYGLAELILSPFGGVVSALEWVTGLRQAADAITEVSSPIQDLMNAFAGNWHLALIVVGLGLWAIGREVFADELESFRKGEWS